MSGRSETGSAPPLLRRLGYWLPVFLALAVFVQVALRGLKPSLQESRHLRAAEERMLERYERGMERRGQLSDLLRAQQDPIFLERERRLLLLEDSPLRKQ
jgi:hypothetical protein